MKSIYLPLNVGHFMTIYTDKGKVYGLADKPNKGYIRVTDFVMIVTHP